MGFGIMGYEGNLQTWPRWLISLALEKLPSGRFFQGSSNSKSYPTYIANNPGFLKVPY